MGDPISGVALGAAKTVGKAGLASAQTIWATEQERPKLIKHIAGAIGRDSRVPHELRTALAGSLRSKLTPDPTAIGALTQILSGEDATQAESTLTNRVAELFADQVGAWTSTQFGTLVAEHARAGAIKAKATDRAAAHLDEVRTRGLIQDEIAGVRHDLQAAIAPARVVMFDWAPETARDEISELAKIAEADALFLDDLLNSDAPGPRALAEIENPSSRVLRGHPRVWSVLARMAEQASDWPAASRAWERSVADDPSRGYINAATTASLAGERERHDEMLAAAIVADPSHPRLRMAQADGLDNPDERLAALADLVFTEPKQTSFLHGHRALAHLQAGRLEPALREIDACEEAWPEGAVHQSLRINYTIQFNRMAVTAGEPTRVADLQRARSKALRLRERLLPQSRWVESARLLMLAVDASAMSWEIESVRATAELARAEELAQDGAALAAALARSSQFDLALKAATAYEGERDDDLERVIAVARYQTGTDAERADAREDLQRLAVSAEEDVARMAAHHLLISAGLRDGEWSEVAERRLSEMGTGSDGLVPLKAYYLARTAGYDAAAALLEGAGPSVHIDDAWLDLARQHHDPRQVEIAHRLLTYELDQLTRIRVATVLRDSGEVERAIGEARKLAFSSDTPEQYREGAFRMLVPMLVERGEANAARDAHDRWTRFAPSSEAAQQWAPRVGALARRARG